MGISSFTGLIVWKKAHANTLEVYKLTRSFPDDERYGLTSQMRRAARSIAANIAEAFGRRKPLDKARVYNISEGSNEELKYLLILAKDLGYTKEQKGLWFTVEEVSRMLRKLVATTTLDS